MKPTDYVKLQQRLAGKEGSGYWRSLLELAQSSEARDLAGQEFPNLDRLWQAPISRRQTLQLLGASMALAGMTSCIRQPEEDIVPYVRMPEHMVPGKPRYYATAALQGGYAQGVLAESHEGRPTKLEGNPDHPATLGACDAITQASVLSLYDPDRSAAVRHRNAIGSYGALLAELQEKHDEWDADGGRGLCFLTESITSPSEQAEIEAIRQRWPNARWFVHDPVDRSAVYTGSQWLFGRALEPLYRFSRANLVLALDADFMQGQPGALRHAHDFMARRRPRDAGTDLARLYAIESTPGPTGAVADHRRSLPYPQVEDAVRQLAVALGLEVTPPAQNPLPNAWVSALLQDLQRNRGSAVLVPGDQQSSTVHALAHAINRELDAFGSLVDWIEPVTINHDYPRLDELTAAIGEGDVSSLVVLGANPVYTAPADLDFASAYQEVPWRLHWGSHQDATALLAHWHVPTTHPLEGWADARAFDGTVSLVQPLIRPLHGGKTSLQMLSALRTGFATDAREALREYWQAAYEGEDFERFWRRSLHDGLVANSATATVEPELQQDWAQQLPEPDEPLDGLIIQLRPDPALWDGRHANNGWLQEMPRPMTTLTWENAVLISPRLAQKSGLEEGDVVTLSNDLGQVEVPVYVLPGQPDRALTLHLGYGQADLGRVANGVGANAYLLRSSQSPWALPVSIKAAGGHRKLAVIQNHHHIEGRDLVRAATLEDYRNDPGFAQHESLEISLYPEPWPGKAEPEHAWGMSIDLSACIGCNSCVTACQAENNIPVVGAEEVARGHDLHWIRVDRYFAESLSDPRTVFQPVPCMHCENAPCEPVCPVGATLHTADGLNQMIYQRCVGTRYCSQNCPYKVRRFNWIDYTSANAAYPAEPAVQNPDVTVRSRGVMEKCTYCVQRINAARLNAESQQRSLVDGELQTACQQACPTQAIVFGDLADTNSEVRRHKEHPLNYAMLAHLNTRPRTTYLAAVRNPNPELNVGEEQQG